MITVYKTVSFDAAHQLEGHSKCGVLHGHTFRAEVWVTGEPAGEFGFVLDFHDLKNYFQQFDHSGLITDPVETMVKNAVDYFIKNDNVKKVKVRIWETPSSYAEYTKG